jgi:hypothetical protein
VNRVANIEPFFRKQKIKIPAAIYLQNLTHLYIFVVIKTLKFSIVAYDNKSYGDNNRNNESIYSKRIKAGKRRTYFFDVKATRGNDYFITITESKKRFEDGGYERHKMFIYKEDFNKFVEALNDTVNYVKTELMPNFDFDAFNNDYEQETEEAAAGVATVAEAESNVEAYSAASSTDSVEEWKI